MKSYRDYYKTLVSVGTISENEGFYDDDAGEYTEVTYFYADVQPYSGDLAIKEYGISDKIVKRVYSDVDNDVKSGMYAKIDDVLYLITYVEVWESGQMMLLSLISE